MRLPDEAPIAAIATPPGRGGIGVLRVSGSGLDCVIRGLLGEARAAALAPRHAAYGPFLAADGSEIDRGLALHFPAPHSYTGEDVFELQGHGGPVVMQLLLRRVLEAGAPIGLRLAMPGEFTQRAYLNEKLDLAQAEAVADLIDATTEQAARSATRSLAGEFSQAIHALVEQVIHLRMLVEATLDFPEEEIDFLERADAFGQLERIRDDAGRRARARAPGRAAARGSERGADRPRPTWASRACSTRWPGPRWRSSRRSPAPRATASRRRSRWRACR